MDSMPSLASMLRDIPPSLLVWNMEIREQCLRLLARKRQALYFQQEPLPLLHTSGMRTGASKHKAPRFEPKAPGFTAMKKHCSQDVTATEYLAHVAYDEVEALTIVNNEVTYESKAYQESEQGSDTSEAWSEQSQDLSEDSHHPTVHEGGPALEAYEGRGDVIGTGCGGGGTVYEHGTDDTKVVKYSDDDVGYRHYVEYCINNQDNPHVPQIYAHHIEDNDAYVVMERLVPIQKYGAAFSLDEIIHVPAITDGGSAGDLGYILNRDSKDLREFIEELEEIAYAYKGGPYLDLHENNTMVREDELGNPECIVVTDPWFWG